MTARQIAFLTIREIEQNKGYTDIVLARYLAKNSYLSNLDKSLISQLVYGTVRHKRTLNSLINQLAQKKARQQPLNLKIILQLGLYQLRYLDKIPPSAVVNTSVELAKQNGLKKLAGVVNGILRNYLRQSQQDGDILKLPSELIPRLGVQYSFPDWIVKTFLSQLPSTEVESLLTWYNQPSPLDIRVNRLQITREELQAKWEEQGINAVKLDYVADGLRLTKNMGDITRLFGFEQGYFTVQAGSTQLVSYILDPQPHETIIDACAAPGGKTTHISELMGNEGKIWACDYLPSRLVKVEENAQRLGLTNIETVTGDSSSLQQFINQADRVLVDAPCSGLGTLHKNPDIRWQQKANKIQELTKLQAKILANTSQWVKVGGILVYATCTLNPEENEIIVKQFLENNPHWQIVTIPHEFNLNFWLTSEGMIKIYPHRHNMDGFFIAKLKKNM